MFVFVVVVVLGLAGCQWTEQGDTELLEQLIALKSARAPGRTRLHKRGAAHVDRSYYWANGTIPYVIWPALFDPVNKPYRKRIESAIWEIEFNSCVRFVEKTAEDWDYVVLYDDPDRCYSRVGLVGGIQITGVGRGCGSRGSVLHELLHTVGMWHTIARIDRDQHVRVLWNNIDLTYFRNFMRQPEMYVTWYNETYDLQSIMHYGTHQFSKNGKPTIVPLESRVRIGQRHGMSQGDKQLLDKMYSCKDVGRCGTRGACVSGRCTSSTICTCRRDWYGPQCSRQCPQCHGEKCGVADTECHTQCDSVIVTQCQINTRTSSSRKEISCNHPEVDCGSWESFASNGDWDFVDLQQGLALESSVTFKDKRTFSVSQKSWNILQSRTLAKSAETCRLHLVYYTSGQWWLSSLEVLLVTGDKSGLIWSHTLREGRSRDVTLKERDVTIAIATAVEFSVLLRVNLYEARRDLVFKTVQLIDCEGKQQV